MKLYICEKPSQGRDLAKILGLSGNSGGFIGNSTTVVTWCVGHMLVQANPEHYDEKFKNWSSSYDELPIVPERWQMLPNKTTSKQLNIVRGLLKRASEVIIATDGDREGETIGRELLEYYDYHGIVSRLWLTDLNDELIRKALNNIKTSDETIDLYYAGLARSRADWLVGLNLTRLVSVKAQKGGYRGVLSIGRVQTPTLALVVARDLNIDNFVAKDYYDIIGVFGGVQAKWQAKDTENNYFDESGRLIDYNYAQTIVDNVVKSESAVVDAVVTERKKVAPPLLYSLSKLQQDASQKLGFSAAETLNFAQSLYEKHKATTYPRTDCEYLSEEHFDECVNVLNCVTRNSQYERLVQNADAKIKSRVFNSGKVTAHHAIIPAMNNSVDTDAMSTNEKSLYDLIVKRYIAQFYSHYEYDKTSIQIIASGELFTTIINVDVAIGWKTVIKETTAKKANTVPNIQNRQKLSIDAVDIENKQTTPPPRYTDGTLIADMSAAHKFITDESLKKILRGNEGIGTEATRANIIETLKQRGFLEVKKGKLVSTTTGRELISIIPSEIKDPAMTAIMEGFLERIATGEMTLDDFLNRQETWLRSVIDNIKHSGLNITSNAKTHPCPECGKDMFLRNSKKGKFWACSGYPECKTTAQNKNGKPLFRGDMPDCPKCGKKLRRVKGKKGWFWSCEGYFDKREHK